MHCSVHKPTDDLLARELVVYCMRRSSADMLACSQRKGRVLIRYICYSGRCCSNPPARSQSDSGPEYLFPIIIMYLIKHPCTSIVVAFSPVLIYMHSSLHPRGGWKKRAQGNPVCKSFVFASRTVGFCTRGIAANAHLVYSDHCGACDEKKMSGFENQTRVGFSKHVTFISD